MERYNSTTAEFMYGYLIRLLKVDLTTGQWEILERSAGRGGLGAVLGSKRLKAIVAVPGSVEVPIYDRQALERLLPELARELKKDRITGEAMGAVGTMIG